MPQSVICPQCLSRVGNVSPDGPDVVECQNCGLAFDGRGYEWSLERPWSLSRRLARAAFVLVLVALSVLLLSLLAVLLLPGPRAWAQELLQRATR